MSDFKLNELSLINTLEKLFKSQIPNRIGIGDDCAVFASGKKKSIVVTTDLLMEDVHFLRRDIDPKDLGYKSLAVSLSDIAAMGGVAKHAFLSIALPSGISSAWFKKFILGFKSLADRYGVDLLGGDTTGSKSGIAVNVTVMGEVRSTRVKVRSGARVGDLVCVTGSLGDSKAGLNIILKGIKKNLLNKKLVERHYRPRPHLEEGQFLAKWESVHAMMDVSDGIESDLEQMARRSGCGAEVYLDQLSISKELRVFCEEQGEDPFEFAALGGEDYCLLVSVDEAGFSKLDRGFRNKFGRGLFAIGRMVSKQKGFRFFKEGKQVRLKGRGFRHF